METRKVILPLVYATGNGAFTKAEVPQFEGLFVAFHLDTSGSSSVFLDKPREGCLMLQEYWDNVAKKIFFDINSKGELIAIFPDGFDGYINEKGELVLIEGTLEYTDEGIGSMQIPTTFEVGLE